MLLRRFGAKYQCTTSLAQVTASAQMGANPTVLSIGSGPGSTPFFQFPGIEEHCGEYEVGPQIQVRRIFASSILQCLILVVGRREQTVDQISKTMLPPEN